MENRLSTATEEPAAIAPVGSDGNGDGTGTAAAVAETSLAKGKGRKQKEAPKPRDVRLRLTLKGTSPLMLDAMPEGEVVSALIRGDRPPKERDANLDEMAAKGLYHAEDGETIVIPTANILACFRDGGRNVKLTGMQKVSTRESSMIFGLVEIEGGEYVPLTHGGWVRDVRRGVGKTGDANGIVRPKFKDWKLTMTLRVRERAPFTLKTFREVVETAGIFAGLGSFRPGKNGPFGKFEIAEWEEIAEEQPAQA